MRHTETTSHLVRALKNARALNLDKLFASGIDVTIDNYTEEEQPHVERVTIHAEFAGPLKTALVDALEKSLSRRVESLESQLRDARAVLGVKA